MAVFAVEIEDLDNWLAGQLDNTSDTPYKINIMGLDSSNYRDIRSCLINNSTKYVDLSYTTMPNPDEAYYYNGCFKDCTTLVYPPVMRSSSRYSWQECFKGCTALVETPIFPDYIGIMISAFEGCTSLVHAHALNWVMKSMEYAFKDCVALDRKPYDTTGRAIKTPNAFENVVTQDWIMFDSDFDISNLVYSYRTHNYPPASHFAIYTEDTQRIIYYATSDNNGLGDLLLSLPNNSVNTKYEIAVDITSSDSQRQAQQFAYIKTALLNNLQKYVSLKYCNLFGRGFNPTSMERAWEGCTNLINAPTGTETTWNNITDFTDCYKGCVNLKTASPLGTSVTNMQGTFYGCTSLETPPTIPSGVTSLEETFSGCTSLVSAPEIPSSVINMTSTFEECSSLVQPPVIPNGVTDLSFCFAFCSNLKTIPDIPASVTSIKGIAISSPKVSNTPTILGNNLLYMEGAFSNTAITTAPVIPNSVIEMNTVFMGCKNLKTVPNIPNSVTKLNRTFVGCSELEVIERFEVPLATLKNNPDCINTFADCPKLTQIGYKINNDQNWHVMSLNIGESTVSGKVYNSSGDATTINSTNITKTTITLPNLTDEILFPPNSLSDVDLETLIQNVLSSKYTWWKRTPIDPNKKTFVLYADSPNNVLTNIGGGSDIRVFDTVSELEQALPNLSDGQKVATNDGYLFNTVDAVEANNMNSVTSNAVANAFGTWELLLDLSESSSQICKIYGIKFNTHKMLWFHFDAFKDGGVSFVQNTTIGTLPSNWRPTIVESDKKLRSLVHCVYNNTRVGMSVEVSATGEVKLIVLSAPISGTITISGVWGDCYMFIS